MRIGLKWSGTILAVALFALIAGCIMLLPATGRARRQLLIRNTSVFSRIILAMLSIRVHATRHERLNSRGHGLLVVANHVSYIDVLVIASLLPSVFVTSVELGNTRFLGMIARLGGSLFVERRKASGLRQEIGTIARMLGDGLPVVLFPEGTTSNGEHVHAFKNSLFDAAVRTGASVLPVCLRYDRVNGAPLTPDVRDSVFYYGGITFRQHLPRVLSLRSVHVRVMPLKLLKQEKKPDRKELALMAHDAIRAAYHG